MKINNHQKKRIHALKRYLGWDDEMYRDMLKSWFDVESCSQLSYSGANECIKRMSGHLGRQSRKFIDTGESFFDIPARREGVWATTAQLWKIWYQWKVVSRQTTDADRKSAFRVWLKNHFNLSDFKMIQREHVSKILHALESMQSQSQSKTEVK